MLPRVPFVSFVLVFILGILAGDFLIAGKFFDNILILYSETAVILLIAAISFLCYKKRKYPAYGICCLIILFVSGMTGIYLHEVGLENDVTKLNADQYSFYEARVISLPEKRSKSLRVEVIINRIFSQDKWVSADVKALLSIPSDASFIPSANDFLIVKGNAERAPATYEPGRV